MTTSGLTTADYRHLFAHWGKKYDKEYISDEDYESRLSVFMSNDALIKSHNANQRHTYKLGHNEFSDLAFDEFKALYMPQHERPTNAPTPEEFEVKWVDLAESAPVSKDWVAEGAVNPVQNQGRCGASWAFSATAAAEGADFIRTKVLKKFSEQQLIDCNRGYDGCKGGLMTDAFEYMVEQGQCLDLAYPYAMSQGKSCEARLCDPSQLAVKRFEMVPVYNEDALKAVVSQQPVSVAVQGHNAKFQFYKSGILTASGCSADIVDHAVVAVGYGFDGEMEYWKVRNSWGTTWGEDGYVRMEMHGDVRGGTCGIVASPASYPVLDDPPADDDDDSWAPWIIFLLLVGVLLCCFCASLLSRWRRRRGQPGAGMEPLLGGGAGGEMAR